ncbi:MAG TPA: hypothetical protein V6D43_19495 [Candidatus Sericytochromatia bacterium]
MRRYQFIPVSRRGYNSYEVRLREECDRACWCGGAGVKLRLSFNTGREAFPRCDRILSVAQYPKCDRSELPFTQLQFLCIFSDSNRIANASPT